MVLTSAKVYSTSWNGYLAFVSEFRFVEFQRFRAIFARNGGRGGTELKALGVLVGVIGCHVQSLFGIKQNYATAIVPVGILVVIILKPRVPWNRY